MTEPQPGQVWLDEDAPAKNGQHRVLFVRGFLPSGAVDAVALTGPPPSANGVPFRPFEDEFTWQGYWSLKHSVLPRLSPPYEGSPLASVDGAHHAAKLSGSAAIADSIVPSYAPDDVLVLDKGRQRVKGVTYKTRVSEIPAGVAYLVFVYGSSESRTLSRMKPPRGLRQLWYQRQQNAWWLVRALSLRGGACPAPPE